jgi:arabinogalactan endo-1,4-beta-galactosidase
MLTYRQNVTHYHQLGAYNCGPVALSCIFNASLEHLETLVECNKNKGTYTSKVVEAMKEEGIECSHIKLDSDAGNHLWWLELNSYRWPIYLGCHFVNQDARGRPSNSHHAVLLANGMIYDGNNHREEPISAIAQKFNKKFVVKDAIIFHHELPNWKSNLEAA